MKKLMFVVASVAVLALAGVAVASIPDAQGVIHGCYKLNNPAKGSVLVVDSEAGGVCPSGFAPLNWSQTGPQGPAGPQGPSGTSGLHLHGAQGATVPANTQITVTASCHSDETAISAGWQDAEGGAGRAEIVTSYPGTIPGGDRSQWTFVLDNNTGISETYVLAVWCLPGQF